MIERHDDINLWTEKLQEVNIPPVEIGWKDMEVRLEQAMPLNGKGDRRRWFLLLFLLLLLIGVCNCPGRLKDVAGLPRVKDQTGTMHRISGKRMYGEAYTGHVIQPGQEVPDPEQTRLDTGKSRPDLPLNVSNLWQPISDPSHPQLKRPPAFNPEKKQSRQTVLLKRRQTALQQNRQTDPQQNQRTDLQQHNPIDTTVRTRRIKSNIVSMKQKIPAIVMKSPKSKANKPGESSSVEPDPGPGWVVGIGLNQFFTVGKQEHSNLNSDGTTGSLSDYLPVPMIRYYLNGKIYFQLEGQINTPQYTRSNLVLGQPIVTSVPVAINQQAIYIKKLFYFNLPLSAHFSPVKNLFIGTGIQYSRLSNAVGLVETRPGYTVSSDSIKITIKSFKSDSSYHHIRSHEFRLLADINYTFKGFILGLRYNRAFSNIITNQEVAGTPVPQAKNSSLQLYLRYILWDQRKKKTSSSK